MIGSKELKVLEEDTAKKKKESLEVEKLIAAIEITDHDSLMEAVRYVAEIKKQHNEIEARRKTMARPLKKATDEINKFFKDPIEPLARAEVELKQKIGEYARACHMERGECLAKVANTTSLVDKQLFVQRAEAFVIPNIPGLSVNDSWGGDIVDPEALKKWAIENNKTELLLINIKVLEALTKSAGADPGIPGWRAERKIGIAITVAKVE